jgi:mono/diheme cytochrome c family protein
MWTLLWGSLAVAQSDEPLYVEHCAGCHGRRGHATFPGVMMGAGSFASEAFWQDRPADRLRKTIAEGGEAVGLKKAMPAFGDRLTAEQIDQLLAIALSFRP